MVVYGYVCEYKCVCVGEDAWGGVSVCWCMCICVNASTDLCKVSSRAKTLRVHSNSDGASCMIQKDKHTAGSYMS